MREVISLRRWSIDDSWGLVFNHWQVYDYELPAHDDYMRWRFVNHEHIVVVMVRKIDGYYDEHDAVSTARAYVHRMRVSPHGKECVFR